MLEPTDRRCSLCGGRLFGNATGAVGCPSCDRPRCVSCRQPFGELFGPSRAPLHSLEEDTAVCGACIAGHQRAA